MAVFRIAGPADAPAGIKARPPAHARLSEHVLLVIVDGLRYDVATDPARMPHFARAMRERRSAEIWAGPVSMTTSAVLAYGTGQPGRLEQIVFNIDPKRTTLNSWLENAHVRGIGIALAGDPAWVRMYQGYIGAQRLDPKGVAIDVNYDRDTFAGVRDLRAAAPDVLIAHFVTPDHQGHAYGIRSRRYVEYIRTYDRLLAELLAEFGPEWTVIVTSDHGAADSGTHGADAAVQRRSPIFAYGPAIAPKTKAHEKLDQLDLAGTFAALLGVSAPAHGHGHLLLDWLALSPQARAQLACEDALRLTRLREAVAPSPASNSREIASCDAARDPRLMEADARSTARGAQAVLEQLGDRVSSAWPLTLCAVLIALAILAVLRPASVLRAAPLASVLLAATLFGLYYNERLDGEWPNVVRFTFFVLCNLVGLLVLFKPARLVALVDAHPVLATLMGPGLLAITYTAHVQPESYANIWAWALVFVLGGSLGSQSVTLLKGRLRVSRSDAAWLVLGLIVLFPAGTKGSKFFPAVIANDPTWMLAFALLAIFAWVAGNWKLMRDLPWASLLVMAAIVFSLLWRRSCEPLVGRMSVVLFAVLAIVALWHGRRPLAIGLGLASYAWVSRDFELVFVVASLLVAAKVGAALEAEGRIGRSAPSLAHVLLLSIFTFALVYVQRIGIQGALDFGAMDWGAGGFRDKDVSSVTIGIALTYKYLLGCVLVLGTLLPCLSGRVAEPVVVTLIGMYVARAMSLLLMLFFCGGSYWTALRVLGDLPFALIGAVGSCLAWLALAALRRTSATQLEPGALLTDAQSGSFDERVDGAT
ncbi:MAG TPA: alkaline phosphatase family protein [Polyangiaceae bacterium]